LGGAIQRLSLSPGYVAVQHQGPRRQYRPRRSGPPRYGSQRLRRASSLLVRPPTRDLRPRVGPRASSGPAGRNPGVPGYASSSPRSGRGGMVAPSCLGARRLWPRPPPAPRGEWATAAVFAPCHPRAMAALPAPCRPNSSNQPWSRSTVRRRPPSASGSRRNWPSWPPSTRGCGGIRGDTPGRRRNMLVGLRSPVASSAQLPRGPNFLWAPHRDNSASASARLLLPCGLPAALGSYNRVMYG
jgi:hypothetical protein